MIKWKNESGFSLTSVLVAAGLMGVLALAVMNLSKQSTQVQRDFSGKMESTAIVNQIRTILSNKDNCTETFQGMNALNGTGLTAIRAKNNVGTFIDKFPVLTNIGQGGIQIKSYRLYDPGLSGDDVDVSSEDTTYLEMTFHIGNAAHRSEVVNRIVIGVNVNSSNAVIDCSAYGLDTGLWTQSTTDMSKIFYSAGNVGINLDDPQTKLDVNGGVKVANSPTCNASLNGLMKYDGTKLMICEDATWRPMSNADQTCAAGEFVKGFDSNGSLICEASSALSTTQSFTITGGGGTTTSTQNLGTWKFCALSQYKTTEDDSNNYDNCQVTGTFESTWTLSLTKHSQDSLTCSAVCLK